MSGSERVISLIVAMDRNRVIGVGNAMPWHLPADLKRFKALTTGHHVIMGRKTFESLGRKPLPGRVNIVITRQRGYAAPAPADCLVVESLEAALAAAAGDSEIFVIGGGEIFALALDRADRVYLTLVDTAVAGGEVRFPELDGRAWRLVEREDRFPDEKNKFAYSYLTYEKKQ